MRPSGSPESLETRRKIAARLFERGMTLTDVAAAVGSSVSSAHRWKKAWRHGSKLLARPHPGRRPRLSSQQRTKLIAALSRGTRHWGYASSGWTGPLVRDMIVRLFDVQYHPDYVPRLLRKLGWSPQKPIQRARERDETAIVHWIREDWPRIKKEPRTPS
jgi:transposase